MQKLILSLLLLLLLFACCGHICLGGCPPDSEVDANLNEARGEFFPRVPLTDQELENYFKLPEDRDAFKQQQWMDHYADMHYRRDMDNEYGLYTDRIKRKWNDPDIKSIIQPVKTIMIVSDAGGSSRNSRVRSSSSSATGSDEASKTAIGSLSSNNPSIYGVTVDVTGSNSIIPSVILITPSIDVRIMDTISTALPILWTTLGISYFPLVTTCCLHTTLSLPSLMPIQMTTYSTTRQVIIESMTIFNLDPRQPSKDEATIELEWKWKKLRYIFNKWQTAASSSSGNAAGGGFPKVDEKEWKKWKIYLTQHYGDDLNIFPISPGEDSGVDENTIWNQAYWDWKTHTTKPSLMKKKDWELFKQWKESITAALPSPSLFNCTCTSPCPTVSMQTAMPWVNSSAMTKFSFTTGSFTLAKPTKPTTTAATTKPTTKNTTATTSATEKETTSPTLDHHYCAQSIPPPPFPNSHYYPPSQFPKKPLMYRPLLSGRPTTILTSDPNLAGRLFRDARGQPYVYVLVPQKQQQKDCPAVDDDPAL